MPPIRIFVAHAKDTISCRVLALLERFGVSTWYLTTNELPPELVKDAGVLVACFDSPGDYPGNYLRILQKADVAPGNRRQFIVPEWTSPIKLGRRVALRSTNTTGGNDSGFEQAIRTMYLNLTDTRLPRFPQIPEARGSGGGYHLPRDLARPGPAVLPT